MILFFFIYYHLAFLSEMCYQVSRNKVIGEVFWFGAKQPEAQTQQQDRWMRMDCFKLVGKET